MLSDATTGTASNGAQTLLIDADDTLWENNIYFERAIANFISFLNHQAYSREEVREVLNDVERESIVTHGYGLHSFAHSLVATFERLSVEPITPELHANHSRLRARHRRSSRGISSGSAGNTRVSVQRAITSFCDQRCDCGAVRQNRALGHERLLRRRRDRREKDVSDLHE